MNLAMIECKIKSLELQLRVLRANIGSMTPDEPRVNFADLRGALKGISSSSDEEIREAQYRSLPEC